METPQVTLHISCDDGFTADFLRELANCIENNGIESIENYETFTGCVDYLNIE